MFPFDVRKCMTQQNEQQRNRMLSLLREGERRMLVQLAGLLRTSADEINAELEKEELLDTLEQPVTVEYLNGVVQHHLFERLHKGDMVAAQRLLTQYQSDIEAMLTQESAEAEAPTEELKAQA
ncbi:TPA: hypothetical protein F3P23_20655 [Aeromonas hydrophila]|uniref:Uncharacterized protein n=3 Tax=Aeromonadaceae TaxID=84642 RepID=A0KGD9_AERHH|nr:hypothetical protein AHA_0787 [Aeromonas hydrophila subsp. hydrophila ATCC 7966]AVP85940.1 hypothetical protein C7K70_18895 [Aeromonas hydrophila]MBM0438025.1 hypothetical protein [Aeromonas hydrophila subsp. ranae]QJT12951.1 hypothetical protein E5E97_08505 [Aeromonas sp. 2692-1]QJT17811.1 hypothetical protein E5E96_11285 [Aeromonas sp. 1805]